MKIFTQTQELLNHNTTSEGSVSKCWFFVFCFFVIRLNFLRGCNHTLNLTIAVQAALTAAASELPLLRYEAGQPD